MRRLLVLVQCLFAAVLVAQSPVGEPFPIAEFTTGRQGGADMARQPNRAFVIVWGSEGADGDGFGVRARRFSGNGDPLTSEFPVNEATAGDQAGSQIAADSLGNSVVVWTGPDQDSTGVFARLFAADGTALGPEFQVNTQTVGRQERPAVSRNEAGDFLVSWIDSFSAQVMAATFDASGATVLAEFAVGTTGTPFWAAAGAGMRSDGEFAVIWVAAHDVGGRQDDDIFQRRYASDGTPLSDEFQVSGPGAYGPYLSYHPDVAVDDSDNFLVVWHDQVNLAFGAVRGRRTDATGDTGPIKELGPEDLGYSFSMASGGEFVVVWAEYSAGYPLSAALFDPLGNEVLAFNAPGAGWPGAQANLSDDATDFVLVRSVGPWQETDLIGQRFSNALFADGFESGDTSAWSSTVP